MTIQITEVSNTQDLFCHYPGQTNPQQAYIQFDPTEKTVIAYYNGEIGNAVPFAVFHGRVFRYAFQSGVPTADAANRVMTELLPLFERIAAGYSEYWDGNNDRGRLTDDAQAASDEIEATLYDYPSILGEGDYVEEWDAMDWLENDSNADLGISANTTDGQLGEIEKQIVALLDENIVVTRIERELERRREQEREKEE